MNSLGIDSDVVENCVEGSFEGEDEAKDDNVLYNQFASEWKQYGVGLYPAIAINGKTFRGRMTPDNVFEAICAAFESEPKQCRAW